jgi:hypothetical protein
MRARVRSRTGGGASGKHYLLLIGKSSLASCWCEHRGKCLEARLGTATRESDPRCIVHRWIPVSNTHLEMCHSHELPARPLAKSKNSLRCHFFIPFAIGTHTEYVCLIIRSPRLRGRIADAPTGSSWYLQKPVSVRGPSHTAPNSTCRIALVLSTINDFDAVSFS